MKKIVSLAFVIALILLVFSCKNGSKRVFKNTDEMVEYAQNQIKEISAKDLNEVMEKGQTFLLIDVRTNEEFEESFIPGAVHITRGQLEFKIDNDKFWEDEMIYKPEKKDLIVIYCKKGQRGALATLALKQLGFTNVKNLKDGFLDWSEKYPEMVEKVIPVEIPQSPAINMPASSAAGSGGC